MWVETIFIEEKTGFSEDGAKELFTMRENK